MPWAWRDAAARPGIVARADTGTTGAGRRELTTAETRRGDCPCSDSVSDAAERIEASDAEEEERPSLNLDRERA
jgi:hypothetical protein